MLSQPTLAVSIHIISPICDHGGPLHSPKTVKTTPKTTRFSFVHVQHPPPTCIKVISSPKGRTDGRAYKWTENLLILKTIKSRAGQVNC